jgi:hypothetical protein
MYIEHFYGLNEVRKLTMREMIDKFGVPEHVIRQDIQKGFKIIKLKHKNLLKNLI